MSLSTVRLAMVLVAPWAAACTMDSFDAEQVTGATWLVGGAIGCADGQREGFANTSVFPNIAACSGGWSIPGIRKRT